MKTIIRLDRDDQNSDPGDVEVEVFGTGRGALVSFKVDGPPREFWLSLTQLKHALAAPVKGEDDS